MNNTVEIIESFLYKLHMFGFPIDRSMNIFFDNGAVCVNITWTESTISNKHHILNCHSAQEAVAEVIVRVSKYHTSTNLADLFTKTMAAPKREGILDKFTY